MEEIKTDSKICKQIMVSVELKRTKFGYSQEKVAEILGIQRETYNRWASVGNKSFPNKATYMWRLLRFLGIESIGPFEL